MHTVSLKLTETRTCGEGKRCRCVCNGSDRRERRSTRIAYTCICNNFSNYCEYRINICRVCSAARHSFAWQHTRHNTRHQSLSQRRTCTSLYALGPCMINLWVTSISTFLEPSTVTSATAESAELLGRTAFGTPATAAYRRSTSYCWRFCMQILVSITQSTATPLKWVVAAITDSKTSGPMTVHPP